MSAPLTPSGITADRDAWRAGFQTRRAWHLIDPAKVAADCSPAHVRFLIADAIADIADLGAENARLRAGVGGL